MRLIKIWKKFIPSLLCVAVILILYYVVGGAGRIPVVSITPEKQGMIDLTSVDLDQGIAEISRGWKSYPSALHSPQDFSGENTGVLIQKKEQSDSARYGTYYTVLKLKPNEYYSICGWSIDCGMRMYANGVVVLEVGTVADNEKEAVPRVNYYTVPIFSGESGCVEILLQYSNFVHNEGGSLKSMYFSTIEIMEQYSRSNVWSVFLLFGGLMFLAVYCFLDYCFFPQREVLFFSFCCMLFCLRNQRMFVTLILPLDYNWSRNYRMILTFLILEILCLFLLEDSMLLKGGSKRIIRVYGAWASICIIALFILPTTHSVLIMRIFYIASTPFFIYFLIQPVAYFLTKEYRKPETLLPFLGFIIIFLSLAVEILLHSKISTVTNNGLSPTGMLLFVFLTMLSLSIKSRKEAIQLSEANKYAQLLEQQTRMRTEFFENISHEIRTPLTIISGYTQRAIRKLKSESANELVIQEMTHVYHEVNRLSALLEQDFLITETRCLPEIIKIDVHQFLARCQGICIPILAKNQNIWLLELPEACPAIWGNEGMLLQILVNLCTNANRHTSSDTLILHLVYTENTATFTLEDHGDGIDAKLLPHIMERGVSGDGKTGLGFPICKEIMETMNGTIRVDSIMGKGTKVHFSLPVFLEESR